MFPWFVIPAAVVLYTCSRLAASDDVFDEFPQLLIVVSALAAFVYCECAPSSSDIGVLQQVIIVAIDAAVVYVTTRLVARDDLVLSVPHLVSIECAVASSVYSTSVLVRQTFGVDTRTLGFY